MTSDKVSRRDAIKVLTAVGAALAATPFVASAFGKEQVASASNLDAQTKTLSAVGKEPLVIVVNGGVLLGFRGQEEIKVSDGGMSAQLHQFFQANSRMAQ